MKKFFSGIFVFLLLVCCGLFYGCGERYSDLTFSMELVHTSTPEPIDDGLRIRGSEGTFDDHQDGSYTLYIDKDKSTSATFQIEFGGVPDDFNYGVSFSLSNEILKISDNTVHTSNGIKKTITAFDTGTTVLTAHSNEGGKTASIVINVVKIADSVSFKSDNLAIANKIDSKLSLKQSEVISLYPEKSNVTKISYEISLKDGEDFQALSSNDLLNYGLRFNERDQEIDVIKQNVSLDKFFVKVKYDNPLANDESDPSQRYLEDVTEVKVVNIINDMQFFLGKAKKDILTKNKITENKVQNLIINIEDMNYFDLIVLIASNGEKVEFNYIHDTIIPVYFNLNKDSYEYLNGTINNDTELTYATLDVNGNFWGNAKYTAYYVKVIATKKTTENDNYQNGEYKLRFNCDYADYKVDGYPLTEAVKIKNDTLIRNFSVNNEELENASIVENRDMQGYYSAEVYINNDATAKGSSLKVDVANPVNILNQNARFTVKFYDKDYKEIEENIDNKFKAQRSVGETGDLVNITNNFDSIFERNTIFYLKVNPKTELNQNGVSVGEVYYMVLTAAMPEADKYADKRAKATIKITIAQGVSHFTSYSYDYNSYKVKEDTGLYETDAEGNKIVQTKSETGLTFNKDTFIGSKTIYLDLESSFDAKVTLSYEPGGASLKNITITSNDETVADIERLEDLNCFTISPKSIGEAVISISTTNLSTIYYINVSVYRPITDFNVNLVSTTTSYGVGDYELSLDGESVVFAEVKVGNEIAFNLTTLPFTAKQYTMEYAVYKEVVDESTLIGEYSIDYTGKTSSNIYMLGNDEFQLDCKKNSFVFIKDECAGNVYVVTIKLTNLDGSYWYHEIELTSYVPVEKIDTDVTRYNLYNPNTIAYISKDLSINDPTVFGMKVEINKASGRIATYNFEDYGKIIVFVNGINENEMTIRRGLLSVSNPNSLILPINLLADNNGYYWFKLNEDYNYKNIISSIYLSVRIKELNYDFIDNSFFEVINAEAVSSLRTNSEESLYFKQGITQTPNIEIAVSKDSAYNKKLFVKSYDILEVKDESTEDEDDVITYYIDSTETTGVVTNLAITETSLSNKFDLSFTPSAAGRAVIIVLPQDKIVTSEENDLWVEKNYVEVEITINEFVPNQFYCYESNAYVLAETFEEDKTYYALTTNLNSIHTLWEDFLALYITVADGIKQPYQISTAQDFYDIGLNGDSVTKKYVLTKDIALDSSKNLQPIGAYYKVEGLNKENFYNGVYYLLEDDGTYKFHENFVEGEDEEKQFYSYGFNGNLSGKYTYRNVHTGKTISYYYQISNLTYVGVLNPDSNGFGLISEIGLNGKVDNLKLNYNYFQPSINGSLIFGGVAATNRGEIKNIQANFQNFSISVNDDLTLGGLVGNNYGLVENNVVTSTGLTGLIKVYFQNKDSNYNIGGLVGHNFNQVIGSYNTEKEIVYTFNSAGFDSSLNIEIGNSTGNAENKFQFSNIGGAVGLNEGFIKNLSIQGKITAPDCYNVGGLIGTTKYNEAFNGDDNYSVKTSYSIATVEGYNNVGGAIGYIDGTDGTVYIYNISAENYVTDTNTYRTLVKGALEVGGLVGYSKKANIYLSYFVSYFDCNAVDNEDPEDDTNYDIISGSRAGGLIAYADTTSIYNCAVNGNVKAEENVAIFVASPGATIANSFAFGCLYSKGTVQTGIIGNTSGYLYSIVLENSLTVKNRQHISDSLGNNSIENISKVDLSGFNGWKHDDQINNGMPYLTINVNGEEQVLFATTPIVITANVYKNNNVYEFYIKNDTDETSLILYYSYDYLNKYPAEDIKKLNVVNVNSFAKLEVFAKTHKTARLNISTSAANVIAINSDGSLKIVGEGKAILTISSKLNKEYKVEIYIVVKYGLTDVNLYSNIALTDDLQDGTTSIEILKSKSYTLYLETLYTRDLQTKNDAELKSLNSVTTRFFVEDNDNLKTILDNIDGKNNSYTINDLFKFNGLTWLYDGHNFYVDVPAGTNPIINPIRAMDGSYNDLIVSYKPIIKETFKNLDSEIILEAFAGQFNLSIIKGATSIIFENNIEDKIEISQLQTQTFTVTLFTDYELDNINDTIELANQNSMLTVVKSDLVRRYKDEAQTVLESISITYTINYKDKMNAVENDLIYNFTFSAISNPEIKTSLKFVIQGQDKINQVYGSIYANLTDFPQQPEKNNIIYNANVGVLSVEVYPFFSNYSRMRVFYQTSSSYPLLMTQLSYNISGEAGTLLTNYPESGSIMDDDDSMLVEKSSGQDTYLLNNLGTYSYSKIYFFSLLVASEVPDNTKYSVFVQFLNRQNIIIETVEFSFTTIALPSVKFGFDETLKSQDNTYYLPLNTENEISVDLVNYDGDIKWEVTPYDVELAQNEIDVLTPKLNEDGVYTMRILRYTSATASDNVFDDSINLLGQKLKVTAYITDGQRTYSSSQDVIVSLFTVKDVKVQNIVNGYMTLPMSTTVPLQVSLDIHYDENLINNKDNWYNGWYERFKNSVDTTNVLYKYLIACGYEIEENFAGYVSQLTNSISKVQYNYLDTSATKTSGIWFYKEGDNSGYLQTERDYNNSTFGVELYNEYFAVYGFQIDTNSSMALKLNLSYTNNEGEAIKNVNAIGIPNVYNHNISVTNSTYKTDFVIEKDFILTFVYKSDLINAIPVSTAEEFMEMKEGFDYRLIKDIVLTDYTPINTAISTFDGNNYNIYITSFSYTQEDKGDCVLGLFSEVSKDTILYNVSVTYTNKVNVVKGKNVPDVLGLSSNLTSATSVNFGGIAGKNNGTLTNCSVSGKVNLTLNVDVNEGTIAEALNGGLVAENSSTGYITNSTVKNFDFNGYGVTGGFVGENYGKIVSSFFDSSSVNNLSSNDTAGFVYLNDGYIYESYVQGYRLETDVDIRNTGAGIISKGTIGGFVHTNQNLISDCYSNISLSSSIYIAGFVYQDTSDSVITRSYSISYKSASDNSTVASPFAGANSANYTKITINGTLNNCYYLNVVGTWSKLTWESDLPTKQAQELTLDQFATHTNFVNYDLSLEYKQGYYADNKTLYDFADGYTWVIIEGKPVIVSTLIDTISQCDYKGKTKDYSSTFVYFQADISKLEAVEVAIGTDKVRVSYYDNVKGVKPELLTDEELVFYTLQDNTKLTLNYYFMPKGDNEAITLYYTITSLENGKVKTKEITSAEYGNNEKKILDTKDNNSFGYIEDKNFRANDTIEITYDENGIVNLINYKVLENASYYYGSNALNISHVVGSRTNPQILYDYESFVAYTSQNNIGKFFRVIRDIDFGYKFSPTAYKTFQGAIQGNYMEFDNLSISFLNNSDENEGDKVNTTSFGLFAKISAINTFVDNSGSIISDSFDTIISNLKLNVIEVLSNTHKYVGVLAGQITANETLSNRKVILSNITIGGMEDDSAYVQGKNAVGGLAGIATGNVVIKDITCSINVNASKEINNGDAGKLLYDKNNINPVDNVAYAGAVIGIFDTNAIEDTSTERNYNANNIIVNGDITIVGGVVGSAFGLVGEKTIVNYVNTVVNNSNKCYLRATVYAGGLVGENRGQIVSSSVTYGELETYSSVGIGTSTLITTNFFYNGYSSNSVIAIGGLVGLNNGGTISNSIATVDVRNKNATIAGGAVGRMIEGNLINVISSGSVLSKAIHGGFIGVVNDYNMALSAGYNSSALTKNIANTNNADDGKQTVISNCVASTNWLVGDYIYYMGLIESGYPVAGFIGLISYSSSTGGIDFIDFEGSNFFSNTLYTTTNSTVPQYYLKVAYKSEAFDLVTNFDEAYIESLDGIDGKQAVHPYSIREMYYEDSFIGANYQIRTSSNPAYNVKPDGGPFAKYIYTIVTATDNIENLYADPKSLQTGEPKGIYTAIDFTKTMLGGSWTVSNPGYQFYKDHFGKFYILEDGDYEEVSSESSFDSYVLEGKTFYFIENPILEKYLLTKTYLTSERNDINIGHTATLAGNKIDNVTLTVLNDFNKINSIYINGLLIRNLPVNTTSYTTFVDENGISTRLYKYKLSGVTLPNGAEIKSIEYAVVPKIVESGEEQLTYYTITYINLKLLYDINGQFIDSVSTKVSNSEEIYDLSVSSKKVIFNNYMSNGYWETKDNFLLDGDYEKSKKYLINLELAEIYFWSSFTTGNPYKVEGNNIYISTAEQLAYFADEVNKGNSFENKIIHLTADIDLSGKYWVPIGLTDTLAFKGTFTGRKDLGDINKNGTEDANEVVIYTIKYATVNSEHKEIIYDKYSTAARPIPYSTPFSVGIFGHLGTTAKVNNLNIIGGDVSGDYAGGLAGYVKGSSSTEIVNITNRNNVTASRAAGGIVGYGSNLEINNCINYASIEHNNISSDAYGFGGIIGAADTLTISNCNNEGNISVFNNKVSYGSVSGTKTHISVGGLVGRASSLNVAGSNNNKGDISVSSNAHTLYVGGVVGYNIYSSENIELKNLKNYSDITVNYTNIFSSGNNDKHYSNAFIGGVVGCLENDLSMCGNEGKISFTISTTSDSFVGIGGVAGVLRGETRDSRTAIENQVRKISQSYNTNNIDMSTISTKTKIALGGICGYSDVTVSDNIIEDCYNAGDLQTDSNSTIYAGGILGTSVYDTNIFNASGKRTERYYVLSLAEPDYFTRVKTSLDIGYVNITNYNKTVNAIGAILGYANNLVELKDASGNQFFNYYLKDAAYSGTTIYTGYSVSYDEGENDYFIKAGSEIAVGSETVKIEELSCKAQLVTTLKNHNKYVGWNFYSPSSGTGKWIQAYDTWFPSIYGNISSSMWSDKQEEVAQEKGYFIVSTPEELSYLAYMINSGKLDSAGLTIKLTDYIDLANRYWIPIGTQEEPFKGTFDGNGYVIRNLTIDGSMTPEYNYGGLFGVIENATVKNLGLESPIIINVDYAGSIAYKATNSTISNVYTDIGSSLVDSGIVAKVAAGGLVAFAENCTPLTENDNKGGIYTSYNNIPVKITNTFVDGTTYVGGLVGKMEATLINNSYNNNNGEVTTTQSILDNVEGDNNSLVITSYADKESNFINVFNLTPKIISAGGTAYSCEPKLYQINVIENQEKANITPGLTPTYEQLVKGDESCKDIWTEEYTLNEESADNYSYPSIRGLGQEWKNTESEALINYNKESIEAEAKNLVETMVDEDEIDYTLVHLYKGKSTEIETTSKSYYLITTEEELAWVSTNVNSGNLLTNNCEFILLRDLDLSGKYWTPIGANYVYPFQGVFNFNGHTINGLTIDSSSLIHGGLFGYTKGAKIVNGYLTNVFIKLKYDDIKTNIYVGSVVGKGYNTTIENIAVDTSLAAFSSSGTFVGGIIGSLTGTQNYSISNVRVNKTESNKSGKGYAYVDFSTFYYQVIERRGNGGEETGIIKSKTINIGAFSTGGNVYAGGIVGYISGYELIDAPNDYLLDVAYNETNIAAVSTSNASNVYLGGAVGYALEEVKLNNIQNSGNLKSYAEKIDMVGGLVGYINNGNIQNGYFDGYIESCLANNTLSYIGGVVAYMQTQGYIKHTVNNGSIHSCDKYANDAVIGGVIGLSTDRTFNNDELSIFSTANGFNMYNAVGIDEQNNDIEIVNSKFSTDLSYINSQNKFDEVLWKNRMLNSKMIYVVGCGVSFSTVSVDKIKITVSLSGSGKLGINMNEYYLQADNEALSETPGIGIAIKNKDGKYHYFDAKLNSTSNIQLGSYLTGKMNDNCVICYVTLIPEWKAS